MCHLSMKVELIKKSALIVVTILLTKLDFVQPVTRKSAQKFAIEPHNKSAILGDSVVLPCRVVYLTGILQWTRDDFALGSDRDLVGYSRYRMIGSDDEGDFSLLISKVSLEDDASFQCQVGATSSDKGMRSRSAKLTVFVPPEPSIIHEGPILKTTAGMKVELTCSSNGGKPAAELHWLDGQGYEIKEGLQYSKSLRGDGKTYDSKLKLTFVPNRLHHKATLSCRSENPALKKSYIAKIKVEVRFQPHVRLVVKSGKIREFDDVEFECRAFANPEEVTYKWFRDGVPIIGDYNNKYVLRSVTRKDNKVTISCEVKNIIGSTTSLHILNVHYRPIIQKRETYIMAESKATVTLVCPVDGNPQPLVTWSHEGRRVIQGARHNLRIKNFNKYKIGRYKCNATIPGFPPAIQEYLVFIKGPPKIKSDSRQVAAVGSTVKLECLAYSVPLPNPVIWHFKSSVIDPFTSSKYDLEDNTLEDGVRSRLIIHQTTEEDFGKYNCSVTNIYGSDDLEILLVQKEQSSLIGIIAGVIGGVVFIITISAIVILLLKYKKDKRKENLHIDLKHELPSGCKVQRNDTEPKVLNDSYRNSTARDTQELNGYVPYTDYARDFLPPPAHAMMHHHQMNNVRDDFYGSDKIDPWYNAGYANPYLSRNSIGGQLSPLPPAIAFSGVRTAVSCNPSTSPTTTTTTTVSALSKNLHIVANKDSVANYDQQSPTTHV